MRTLSKYEDKMRTAVFSRWTRGLLRTELEEIHAVFCSATGQNRRLNTNCASCILELLTDTGRLYFAQKGQEQAAKSAKVSARSVKVRK